MCCSQFLPWDVRVSARDIHHPSVAAECFVALVNQASINTKDVPFPQWFIVGIWKNVFRKYVEENMVYVLV